MIFENPTPITGQTFCEDLERAVANADVVQENGPERLAVKQEIWKAIDEHRVVRETLGAIKRAGADIIITYWAPELAQWVRD